jgi:hypothetical protein
MREPGALSRLGLFLQFSDAQFLRLPSLPRLQLRELSDPNPAPQWTA